MSLFNKRAAKVTKGTEFKTLLDIFQKCQSERFPKPHLNCIRCEYDDHKMRFCPLQFCKQCHCYGHNIRYCMNAMTNETLDSDNTASPSGPPEYTSDQMHPT